MREQQTGVRQPAPRVINRVEGGPLVSVEQPAQAAPRSRLRLGNVKFEKIALGVIALAAVVVLLFMLGPILSVALRAFWEGLFIALFVGMLTLSNLRAPSGWANKVLGRQVFPVLQASDGGIVRLAAVNMVMMFAFAFLYSVVASLIGVFFGGLVVFVGLVAAGIFYNRARKVVIKP